MSALEFVKVKTESDIETVAALAKEIWQEYYTPILGEAQVKYMVSNFQSAAAIKKNCGEGYHYRYYLLKAADEYAGYLAFTIENGTLFISKVYIKNEFRGKGFFSAVIDFLKQFCTDYDLYKLWLTVNKNNTNSIAAYEHVGFKIDRAQVTDIGEGFVMDDYVMSLLV